MHTPTPIDQAMFDVLLATAQKATCTRSACGSIIVSQTGDMIGTGYNSPPAGHETQRRCTIEKTTYHKKVTDKTCCMHAEQRAIFDAFRHNPEHLSGATLYFLRLDNENNPSFASNPYCTICSKMALDCNIAYFALYQKNGWHYYETQNYNNRSYQFCIDVE